MESFLVLVKIGDVNAHRSGVIIRCRVVRSFLYPFLLLCYNVETGELMTSYLPESLPC